MILWDIIFYIILLYFISYYTNNSDSVWPNTNLHLEVDLSEMKT